MLQHACCGHQRDCGGGIRRVEQFADFCANPFLGKTIQPICQPRTGIYCIFVRPSLGVAIPCIKPEKPKDTQIIFADTQACVFDEPDTPCQQIGQAVQWVHKRSVRRCIKCVEREIAALGVVADIVGKCHNCPPSIGFDILAKRRDLVRFTVDHHRDGAMFDPCWHRSVTCRLGKPRDLFGGCAGRDIDIGNRLAKQRVSHAAPDDIGLMSGLFEHRKNSLRSLRLQPVTLQFHGNQTRSDIIFSIRAVAPQI